MHVVSMMRNQGTAEPMHALHVCLRKSRVPALQWRIIHVFPQVEICCMDAKPIRHGVETKLRMSHRRHGAHQRSHESISHWFRVPCIFIPGWEGPSSNCRMGLDNPGSAMQAACNTQAAYSIAYLAHLAGAINRGLSSDEVDMRAPLPWRCPSGAAS